MLLARSASVRAGATQIAVVVALLTLTTWPPGIAATRKSPRIASHLSAVAGMPTTSVGPVVGTAVATPAADSLARSTHAPGGLLSFSSGMTVTLEPSGVAALATGRDTMAVPSPARTRGILRTTAGLTAVRLADGTMMLDLQGRFLEFTVARIDSTGRAVFGCAHGAAAVRRALDPCAVPASGRYEER